MIWLLLAYLALSPVAAVFLGRFIRFGGR